MSIKSLLTFIFAIFSLSAVIAFAVGTSISLANETEREYVDMIETAAIKQAGNLQVYINTVEGSFAALLENVNSINDADTDEDFSLEEFFKAYQGERSDITSISLVAAGGAVEVTSDENVVEKLDYDRIGSYADNKIHAYNPGSGIGLFAKAPVEGGTLIVTYSGTNINRLLDGAVMPSGGRVFFLSPSRNVIDEGAYYQSLRVSTAPRMSEYIEIENLVNSLSTKYNFRTNNNTDFFACRGDAGETGWTVVGVGNIDMAQKTASDATNVITVLTVLICIAGLVGTFFAVGVFTKPLNTISRTIMQIRRGDHDVRIKVMANNEYGEIARLFNDLIDDIVVGESRYRTIIEMSDNVIFEWNKKTNEVTFSNNFNKKFSYRSPSDHFGDSFLLKCKVHPDDAPKYREDLEKLGKGEDFKHNEYRIKNIYNDFIWVLIRTASIKDANNEIIKTVGVIVDIDRAKKSEENLVNRASYDALTNVYNRDSIESFIESEIDLVSVRREKFTIFFVDIDDFKDFNDNFSHATGDQVLKFTAQTLNNIVAGFGMVGRYGGDEFLVMAKNPDVNDPSRIAEEIMSRLSEGYTADTGDRISIKVSIGIYIVVDSSERVEIVVGAADDAMYKIKKSGKSNYFINAKQSEVSYVNEDEIQIEDEDE
ncbi:MAG: diguanylate cyclase [Oscillospiraceae bacterium]|nr:diguanylate cyclase [Oscillospiraceae bacterium]